jgi:inhibitor of KinA
MGDSAFRVEYPARLDATTNTVVRALAAAVTAAGLPGVRDVVPTAHAVAVYFDPLRTDYEALVERVEREAALAETATDATASLPDVEPIAVPVCYGGEFGPDLAAVAAFAGLDAADVVALHSGPTYRVFMLGFVPGFAYLGTVDARIAAPRLATPRVRVPAGAVGIAGTQTGIYPGAGPGGWQIVGRTPVAPFDLTRAEPFLFQVGDCVRFYPVSAADFADQGDGT